MGCCGERERGPPEPKARWDFINLDDFKNTSFWTPLAYGWLWFMGFVAVAVTAVDTFTAVQLIAFDEWSSSVDPFIPFQYSKWIFAICIFLSWALLIYEWLRALRVIKRRGVAASYMDPLAMSLQSMRSKGYKRFLVFSELTKSKKGTDYVAFFVYFAFQSAIRVILCEGPRQVVNGLTIGSLFEERLINQKETEDQNPIAQFFLNFRSLGNENAQQAVILGSMMFTLIIWVFSALCLLAAGILYVVFLWHYIPQRDGRLRIYCRRKIDRRLEKIVEDKVKAAIDDENRKKEKLEQKAELKRQKTGELPPPAPPKVARQPTLPQLAESPELKSNIDNFTPGPLNRVDTNGTVATLPVYSSRPPTRQGVQRQPTLPDLTEPQRSASRGSEWNQTSFEADAPLLANAGYAGGESRVPSPAPSYYPRKDSNASSTRRPIPDRNFSQNTQSSQRPITPVRMDTDGSLASRRPPPVPRLPIRANTYDQGPQFTSGYNTSPDEIYGGPMMPPPRQGTANGFHPAEHMRNESDVSYFSRPVAGTPGPRMDSRPTQGSLHNQPSFSRPMGGPPGPGMDRRPPQGSQPSFNAPLPRNPTQASTFHRPFAPSPAPEQPHSYEMTSQPSYASLQQNSGAGSGYVAFNPGFGPPQLPEGPPRSATAPSAGPASYESILDEYGAQDDLPPAGPPRSRTASPWQNHY